jgi:hypothetical protein
MNARNSGVRRKKRSRTPFILGALALLAVVLVVIVAIFAINNRAPKQRPPHPAPSTARPTAQPADCPDVQTIVIPGTWESAADDSPTAPHANPNSLLLQVSRPLSAAEPASRNNVYTVPYVAQFRNPLDPKTFNQVTYDESRAQGTKRAKDKITQVNEHCPLTSYLIIGFSQGAVIGGDIANDIANGRGPVDPDLVLGVGLIADGRRDASQVQNIGPNPPGVGAERAVQGLPLPGITMTGTRPGGFGVLADKVESICAPGDLICDAPTIGNLFDAANKLLAAINNPVHAMYGTTKYWQLNGQTATQWMTEWAERTVAAAPHPAHN